MVAKMEEEMHRMMCTFLAVLFSTRNRSTTLNFMYLVMQVFTVCVLLCMLRLCKHHGEEDTSRLIGLFKSSFYKSKGKGPLSWDELCEVVLDIEVSLNHRPLSHVEGDPQFPTLTRSSLLFLNANILPELEPHRLEDRDLRLKFLKATKDTMWRR